MAENKADKAPKEAYIRNELKVCYNGPTPEKSGAYVRVNVPLRDDETPWLIKYYVGSATTCQQFVDVRKLYSALFTRLAPILDAAFVNAKQRDSVATLIDDLLCRLLLEDQAHEGDSVI